MGPTQSVGRLLTMASPLLDTIPPTGIKLRIHGGLDGEIWATPMFLKLLEYVTILCFPLQVTRGLRWVRVVDLFIYNFSSIFLLFSIFNFYKSYVLYS